MSAKLHRLVFKMLTSHPPGCSSVRLYGRWMHRTPAKVSLPFEPNSKVNLKKEKVIDLDPGIITKTGPAQTGDKEEIVLKDNYQAIDQQHKSSKSSFAPEKSEEILRKREEKLKKHKFYLSQQKVFDDNGEIIYEKLKEKDSRISSLIVNLKSKKDRVRSGLTLVEGWRLIMDGLEAKCTLKYVIFSRTEDLNNLRPFLPKTGVKLFKMPYREMQLWSDVETSPGIFGIFETPKVDSVRTFSRALPLQFLCDNIRVPGNLGAILRVAVGVGCEKVLLSKGCTDVWDPKVIRSGAGAHFRLPIYHSIEWTEMPTHLEEGTSVFIADSNAKQYIDDESQSNDDHQMPVLPYYGVEFSTFRHITLIIGGETESVSEDSYALAAQKNGLRLNIPLQRGVDSLNTGMAAAVIAFEIRKQLIQTWTKEKYGTAVRVT